MIKHAAVAVGQANSPVIDLGVACNFVTLTNQNPATQSIKLLASADRDVGFQEISSKTIKPSEFAMFTIRGKRWLIVALQSTAQEESNFELRTYR